MAVALFECRECRRQVHDNVSACPWCGVKPRKRTNTVAWVLGAVLAAAVINGILSPKPASPPRLQLVAKPAKTPEQLAAEARREATFQRTVAAARHLKAALRDPSSLEWESIRANDDASVICFEYRAKNGFGGFNKEFVVFDGTRVSQKLAAWNKHCTQPLNNMRSVRHAL